MGGSLSSPSAQELIQAYGTNAILDVLGRESRFGQINELNEETVDSAEQLLSLDPKTVYDETSNKCSTIVTNNLKSHNFADYIKMISDQLLGLASKPDSPTSNSQIAMCASNVFNCRIIFRKLIEMCDSNQIIQQMNCPPINEGDGEGMDGLALCHTFLFAITEYLIQNANFVSPRSMYLYRDVLCLLLTLFGTQVSKKLVRSPPTELTSNTFSDLFLDLFMMPKDQQNTRWGKVIRTEKLSKVLIGHYIARKSYSESDSNSPSQKATPSDASTSHQNTNNHDLEGGSTQNIDDAEDNSTWSAFVEIGRFFAFPFSEFAKMLMTGDTKIARPDPPLFRLSISLLLVLVNYNSSNNPAKSLVANLCFAVSSGILPSDQQNQISFPKLYQTLLENLDDESTLIFLYFLIQENKSFISFLTSRADLDHLILPLLSICYTAQNQTRVQVYVVLILMLILTYSEHFIDSIQAIKLDTPKWFKETYIAAIPLPEMICLVLLRTIQTNLRIIRDSYLHMNCLACIGNLAPRLVSINLYTSKRLIQTFDAFSKKYTSLMRPFRRDNGPSDPAQDTASLPQPEHLQNQQTDDPIQQETHSTPLDHSTIDIEAMETSNEDAESDQNLMAALDAYEDYLRTLLEIFDCMFRKKPSNNIMFIYLLILQPNLFDTFLHHERLNGIANQLKQYTETFLKWVQAAECNTPTQVIETIKTSALSWKSDPSMPLPDLRFAYEETESSTFFTPSIWKLCLKAPLFYWNPESILLFETETDSGYRGDDHHELSPHLEDE